MRKPVITLTTDFGARDHFVGVMKGAILSICPEASIVDISHEVEPFQISEGAFLLAQAYRYFPPETIHVVVVDPGVGSSRRPILVEAAGQFFVGPDNGAFAMICLDMHQARHITAEQYFLKPVSRTFHGRDIFAPTAAQLANGVLPSAFGEIINDYVRPGFAKPEQIANDTWLGSILHADRFGNLITNFHVDSFDRIRVRALELSISSRKLTRFELTYAEVAPGEPFVLVGSSGYMEVAVNQASAARMLNCAAGSPCQLRLY